MKKAQKTCFFPWKLMKMKTINLLWPWKLVQWILSCVFITWKNDCTAIQKCPINWLYFCYASYMSQISTYRLTRTKDFVAPPFVFSLLWERKETFESPDLLWKSTRYVWGGILKRHRFFSPCPSQESCNFFYHWVSVFIFIWVIRILPCCHQVTIVSTPNCRFLNTKKFSFTCFCF